MSHSEMHAERDVTREVKCETSAEQVVTSTGQSDTWVAGMLIHRQGVFPNANMTAIGLHAVVKGDETYRVSTQTGLTLASPSAEGVDLESVSKSSVHDEPPAHLTIAAVWDTDAVSEGGQENILGDNVIFQIRTPDTEIAIPVLDASAHPLGYYGAILIDENTMVRFPNDPYPIWKMQLGEMYIDGFIMTSQGKGFYLEYHHDRPHWHQPLTEDSGGYYILAREVGVDGGGNRSYHLTGFRIPYGKAVYTGMGAIHCDAALTGENWLVGYTDSNNFSTALVRNLNGDWVRISAA